MNLCLLRVGVHNGAQRQKYLRALVKGQIDLRECLSESGHIRQGELDIEEALVQQFAGGAVWDGARITELCVDHQSGFVEANQLATQSTNVALTVFGILKEREGQSQRSCERERCRNAACA